jgi:hypothetical protein
VDIGERRKEQEEKEEKKERQEENRKRRDYVSIGVLNDDKNATLLTSPSIHRVDADAVDIGAVQQLPIMKG